MSIRKSLAFSLLDRYASLVVAVVSSMVLARLLTPSQIGVFAVTMALLALVSTMRDFGAGQYLLQERELTRDRIRAVWTVQLSLGLVLAALIAAAASFLARFFREPEIEKIMYVLAVNYLLGPFGSITYAWLMREMRYDAVAVARFSGTLAGATCSVVLAYRDFGPISLAYGSVITTCVNAVVASMFRPTGYPWVPGTTELRRVLSFGVKFASSGVASTIATNSPEYFLGRLQSVSAVGYFSRANGLVQMFNRLITDAIGPVAYAWFSKASREGNGLAAPLLNAINYVVPLAAAFAVVVALLAYPLIRLLYGGQWDDSVDVARLLALGMFLSSPLSLCGAALISAGRVDLFLRLTLLHLAATLAAVGIGAHWGLVPVAALLTLVSGVVALCWLGAARRVVGLAWPDLVRVFVRGGVFVGACSGVAPFASLVVWGDRPESLWPPLLFGVIGATAGFVVAITLIRHPIKAEIDGLVNRVRGKASA